VVVHRGLPVGRWVARQKSGWERLNDAQRSELLALGLTAPDRARRAHTGRQGQRGGDGRRRGRRRGGGAGRAPPQAHGEEAFAIALHAATAYRERVGRLEVPRGHVETVAADGWREDVRLGVWVTTTRNRRAKLPAERIAALDAIGMRWT